MGSNFTGTDIHDVPTIHDHFQCMIQDLRGDEKAEKQLPGFADLLQDYIDPNVTVDSLEFTQRFLRVFKDSPDDTYSKILDRYDDDEKQAIDEFVGGEKSLEEATEGLTLGPTLGAREEAKQISEAHQINLPLASVSENPPHDFNAQSAFMSFSALQQAPPMAQSSRRVQNSKASTAIEPPNFNALDVLIAKDAEFTNWGQTVKNTPKYTFVPKTIKGVTEIVKFGKKNDMSVRVSGYRHSWSPSFSKTGHILISTLGLSLATKLPNLTALPGGTGGDEPNELNSITWADAEKYQVRVGCGVTNEQLRRWCNGVDEKVAPRATLPLNVIMVEITFGGSNAPICHGAGITNKTLSDLVKKIEYVDANGVLRVIDEHDEEFLTAASGCFGLIGVITHLTLQLQPMSYALLTPVKVDVINAVPPPPGMDPNKIPKALRKKVSPEQRAIDQANFESRALEDYYSEWFWFPYSSQIWINSWKKTDDPKGVESYPGCWGKYKQLFETVLMQIAQNTLIYKAFSWWKPQSLAMALSLAAMNSLPDKSDGVIKTYLPDALHFRRSIQNVRVRDVEVEMPLQMNSETKKIDFANVQRAWWDAIVLTYEASNTAPMRMPLEMRIMADSNVVMAPQRGNIHGTCSIEVLTLQANADKYGWSTFAQKVIDTWMSYKDAEGRPIKTRPHWAKEWHDFKVNGKPWLQKLKNEDYVDEIAEFKGILTKIGKRDGWTLDDIQDRFSNEMLDKLIFD